MVYYNVAKIGTGADEDSIRPDLPDGVSWVGVELSDGTFLIGTQMAVAGLTPLMDSQLSSLCASNGVSYTSITSNWNVS